MLETITLTEVTDVITPEEETTPENYNFAMESTWEETIYSQGGGGGVTPEGSLDISENGTYDVTDYAEAAVNVPNTYSASDEGKVVDDGALVAQTSKSISANGTYDTTTNDEVVVNVPTGITPSGSQTFTENGTYDVTNIAEAVVNVSGGSTEDLLTAVNNNTLTSYVGNPNLTSVKEYMFRSCSALTEFDFTYITSIASQSFYGTGLVHAFLPNAVAGANPSSAFRACSSLIDIVFAGGLSRTDTSLFEGCSNLERVDFGVNSFSYVNTLNSNAFYNTQKLEALILRPNKLVPLSGAFPANSALSSSTVIYVPSAYVDTYKAATNWITYADRIVSIEGSVYETHYANGTPIE